MNKIFFQTCLIFCFVCNVYLKMRQTHLGIVGGIPADLQKFPYNVQIYNIGNMCGGVILSRKIVLTAAHCFDINKMLNKINVLSNTRYIFDTKSNVHDVWALQTHEHYNATTPFENDIALVIIKDYFIYGQNVQKAYLCTTNIWMRSDEQFLVTGWGETEFGSGVHKQVLRMTYMEYVPKAKCMKANGVNLTRDMFCMHGDGARDACRGDSGGGVFWNNMVVGIISHGKGCASTPSMFVNLFYLKPWIDKNVKLLNNMFCTNFIDENVKTGQVRVGPRAM